MCCEEKENTSNHVAQISRFLNLFIFSLEISSLNPPLIFFDYPHQIGSLFIFSFIWIRSRKKSIKFPILKIENRRSKENSSFENENMLMESSIANGGYSYRMKENYSKFSNDYRVLEKQKNQSLPTSSLPVAGFIEHPVSRFDTLSGVAIKYGVEVADIAKMNGLVTDRQMFALKSLRIPLPGRHPPSPCSSNSSDTPRQSSANKTQHSPPDILDSFRSLRLKTTPRRVSSAMSSLKGYYGHKATERENMSEGKGEAHYRKLRSLTNGCYDETVDIMSSGGAKEGEPDQSSEKLIRRRQKSEVDFTTCTPERLLEDNTRSGGYSTIIAKGLALRSKAINRTNPGADAEVFEFNPTPTGNSIARKSPSTSSLQDQDSCCLSSLWPTSSKWSLKPDFQAVSTIGITRPIFDGLPKPMSGRKNKAALD